MYVQMDSFPGNLEIENTDMLWRGIEDGSLLS